MSKSKYLLIKTQEPRFYDVVTTLAQSEHKRTMCNRHSLLNTKAIKSMLKYELTTKIKVIDRQFLTAHKKYNLIDTTQNNVRIQATA